MPKLCLFLVPLLLGLLPVATVKHPSPFFPPPSPPPQRHNQPLYPYWLFVTWLPMLLAIVAARKLQQRQREEEETKTPYTEEDLMDDWEFKILRDGIGRFGRQPFLDRILRKEAAAGWQLVEKFDCSRVRLKRRVSQRSQDVSLPPGTNPYRTTVPGSALYVIGVVGAVLFGIGAGLLAVATVPAALDRGASSQNLWLFFLLGAIAATAAAVGCGALAWRAKRA